MIIFAKTCRFLACRVGIGGLLYLPSYSWNWDWRSPSKQQGRHALVQIMVTIAGGKDASLEKSIRGTTNALKVESLRFSVSILCLQIGWCERIMQSQLRLTAFIFYFVRAGFDGISCCESRSNLVHRHFKERRGGNKIHGEHWTVQNWTRASFMLHACSKCNLSLSLGHAGEYSRIGNIIKPII